MLGITRVQGSRSARHRNPTVRSLCAIALAALCIAPADPAHAATTGTVSLASDYVFRGVSQTNKDPALQGGIEILIESRARDSGFYAGAWGSNVSWLSDLPGDISSSLELDGYVGYRAKLGEHFEADGARLRVRLPASEVDGLKTRLRDATRDRVRVHPASG